jgi:hypothetical protein
MQYLILIHDLPGEWAKMDEAAQQAGMAEYMAFTQAIRDEGIMVGGDALTMEAKLVRVRDGATTVSDGPYAETREQLGGYYLVECDSLEQACQAAARVPSARWGTIEVRPIAQM